MDDSSFTFGSSQLLEGITTIAPNERVVFLIREAGEDLPTLAAAFQTFWGNIDSIQIGTYLDSGTGFSSGGDGVVVFDSAGVEVTPRASFGAATGGVSFRFDDSGAAAGLSVAGQFGAFVSANALGNVGSPGISAVPEPSLIGLVAVGLAGVFVRARRRQCLSRDAA